MPQRNGQCLFRTGVRHCPN